MFDYQTIIVLVIVAAAAIYVARAFYQSVTSKPGGSCGSCNSCDDESTKVKTKLLVALDDDAQPRSK